MSNAFAVRRDEIKETVQALVVDVCFVNLSHIASTRLHRPTTWSTRTKVASTNTTFRIVLMLAAIGTYVLISRRTTPTTICVSTRFKIGR
jgi:hypothetical protein